MSIEDILSKSDEEFGEYVDAVARRGMNRAGNEKRGDMFAAAKKRRELLEASRAKSTPSFMDDHLHMTAEEFGKLVDEVAANQIDPSAKYDKGGTWADYIEVQKRGHAALMKHYAEIEERHN